jgi:hypothetical protein
VGQKEVKAKVIWTKSVWDLFSELPNQQQTEILARLDFLQRFPRMYPVRIKGRRFRRHRWFLSGEWLVFYRVAGETVYIRGLWPARIP